MSNWPWLDKSEDINTRYPIVIKDFISDDDIAIFIDYMDKNYTTFDNADDLMFTKRMGYDNVLDFEKNINAEYLSPIKDLIIKYSNKFEDVVKEHYHDSRQIYTCQFWLCKRFANVWQHCHSDTDSGRNTHLVYSAIIYLNSLEMGGEITFPKIKYTYTPKKGDVVIFESGDPNLIHGVNMSRDIRYTIPMWITYDHELRLVR